MKPFHLYPEEHGERDDQLEVPAVLEGVRGERTRLYFRLPASERHSVTLSADPFVLVVIFHALRAGAPLVVHGPVSPSLLRWLEEFQTAWCLWRPDHYQPISVTADVEREEAREQANRTVMTFSGGLDSCCTAWRQTRGNLARRRRGLEAAVMVHGFDIPVEQDEVFALALENSRGILDSIDVPLIPMASNVRVLEDDWEDIHGAALAACLHLLSGGYSTGLIASSHVYEALRLPWGSNPVTDPMLSSEAFAIVHDGCELSRWGKADEIGDWDEAMRHLRVCHDWEHPDLNCGVCVTCVYTAFCFYAVGRMPPQGLLVASPEEAVDRLGVVLSDPVFVRYLGNLVETARQRHINDPWVTEVADVVSSQTELDAAGVERELRWRAEQVVLLQKEVERIGAREASVWRQLEELRTTPAWQELEELKATRAVRLGQRVWRLRSRMSELSGRDSRGGKP